MRALTASARALVLLPFLATSAVAATPAASPAANKVVAKPVEASLKAKASAFREQFHSTRNSLLAGNGPSYAKGAEVGVGAALVVGGGIKTGLIKVVRDGKAQIRLNIAPWTWIARNYFGDADLSGGGVGAFATLGTIGYRGEVPATETQRGNGFGFGLGGSRTEGKGTSTQVMLGAYAGGFGGESRANITIPLTPKWPSSSLRQSTKGIRLADQAMKAIDSNDTAKAAALLDKMEVLSISLDKSIKQ